MRSYKGRRKSVSTRTLATASSSSWTLSPQTIHWRRRLVSITHLILQASLLCLIRMEIHRSMLPVLYKIPVSMISPVYQTSLTCFHWHRPLLLVSITYPILQTLLLWLIREILHRSILPLSYKILVSMISVSQTSLSRMFIRHIQSLYPKLKSLQCHGPNWIG